MEAGSAVLFLLWIGKQVLEGEMKISVESLFSSHGGIWPAHHFAARFPHERISARHGVAGAFVLSLTALLCFLAAQTLLRGSQARTLALIFSVYGAVVAGFALIQGISSNGKLYWLRQPRMEAGSMVPT